jgi:poly(ADP-ribose) glycohydrolase ARH3
MTTTDPQDSQQARRGFGRRAEARNAVLKSHVRGALLGTMVGDAAGAPWEGSPGGPSTEAAASADAKTPLGGNSEAVVAGIELDGYLRSVSSLRYTDDTEMMVVLAESLAELGEIDPDQIALAFAERMDASRGYGTGAIQVLRRIADGEPWQTANRAAFSDGSFGNGAAMRVAPVGAFYHHDPSALHGAAVAQAQVTHAHPDGVAGAVVQAHAVGIALFAGLHQQPIRPDYFLRAVAGRILARGMGDEHLLFRLQAAAQFAMHGSSLDELRDEIGNGVTALEAVPAALALFLAARGEVQETLGMALQLGGDTDTIAAMAGALAGAYWGEDELPASALEALAAETRGVDYVRAVADRLTDRWRKQNAGQGIAAQRAAEP